MEILTEEERYVLYYCIPTLTGKRKARGKWKNWKVKPEIFIRQIISGVELEQIVIWKLILTSCVNMISVSFSF